VPANFLKLRRWAAEYVRVREGRIHYDLPGTNVRFLEEAGIPRANILRADLCTFAEAELLHSFRREGTGSGHQGMVAAWPE
jgi:copper oxidase (laccase) domain-containing protein